MNAAFFKSLFPRRLKDAFWRKIYERLSLKRTLYSGYSIKVASYTDWCVYNDLFVDGEYDPAIRAALDLLDNRQSFRVVDLGANVGFFTLRVLDLLQRRHPHISDKFFLLIEGAPSLCAELRERLGHIDDPGLVIEIVNGLVGEKQGTTRFQINYPQVGNSIAEGESQEGILSSYVNVDTYAGPKEINLLKCDIEGAEDAFLRNYSELLQRTEIAVIEFHEPRCSAAAGVPRMMAMGFKRNEKLLDQGKIQTWLFSR